MKVTKLFGAIALIAAASAHCETVALGKTPCGTTNPMCYSVPNNDAITISYIDWARQYARLLIRMDGVTYDSGIGGVQNRTVTNTPLVAPNGTTIYATLHFNVVVACNSRRCTYTYTLLPTSTLTTP